MPPKQLSASHRRVLMTTCQAHGSAGFTNLLVTKEDGVIVLNPHVANCCVLRLNEEVARALHGLLGDWLHLSGYSAAHGEISPRSLTLGSSIKWSYGDRAAVRGPANGAFRLRIEGLMAAKAVTEGKFRWAGLGRGFQPANESADLYVVDSWLVSDGRIRALGRHAERFGAACSELFAVPRRHTETFLCSAMMQIPSRGRWFPRVELVVQGGEPHFQLWIRPAPPRGETVQLWTSDEFDRRHRPTIKGTDLDYLLTLRRLARAKGADEALIVSADGRVREGSTTSILWWRGDTLYAPPLSGDLLPGITRKLLFDGVAAQGLQVATESLTPAELDGLEVWAVNALHGIRPVKAWFGALIRAGPASRAPHWNAYLDRLAVPQQCASRRYIHQATSSPTLKAQASGLDRGDLAGPPS